MKTKKLNIVLVLKSGVKFSYSDVSLLAYHLQDKWGSVNIICIKDGIEQCVELTDGVTLFPMEIDWPNWWSKMNMFSPVMAQFRPFLYLDLDTAIVGDRPDFSLIEDKFVTLEDFYRRGDLASGMMWIPKDNEKINTIWRAWMFQNKNDIRQRGDQEFMRRVVSADAFFQNVFPNKIITYKPRGQEHLQEVPKGTSVVCFHGIPKIPEAAKQNDWVFDYVNKTKIRTSGERSIAE